MAFGNTNEFNTQKSDCEGPSLDAPRNLEVQKVMENHDFAQKKVVPSSAAAADSQSKVDQSSHAKLQNSQVQQEQNQLKR